MQKILIIDDEPSVARTLEMILKKFNYHVLKAANGEEGINAAFAERPDLIFLDLMMPKKNGYEVCRELRQASETQNTYIIVLSAVSLTASQLKEIGANEYMPKPFNPRHVKAHVTHIMSTLMNQSSTHNEYNRKKP